MLSHFIKAHRDEIIERCKAKVAVRLSLAPELRDPPTDGIPLFLDQLIHVLRAGGRTHPGIGEVARRHGARLRAQGFTVSQVVHDYGDVCQSITELAIETAVQIASDDFCTLNLCLDDAIAGAVTEYGREPADSRAEASREAERWGFFTHELRNLVNTAMLSFDVLRTGNVGMAGSTGAVLHRSLIGLRAIISQSEAGVRLTQGIQRPERIDVADFIRDLGSTAALDARSRRVAFSTVPPAEEDVWVVGDKQVLAAVVMNLLQNAFKFTRPDTAVVLRVHASAERVRIEVEDACGGLAGAAPEDLFRPFEQRGADRTGLGLGLAFSRWGAEANNGQVYARSLGGRGCVFTVELPRFALPVVAA